MKFLVNSNIDYYPITRPIVVEGLLAAGAKPEDIVYVAGGFPLDQYYVIREATHTLVLSPQRSIDYTALIAAVELNLEADVWFMLHDTCAVGPKFLENLARYPVSGPTRALLPRVSMNMGAYRHDYLMSIKDRLLAVKNINLSPESMAFWKTWGVNNEDEFLLPISDYYCDTRQLSGPVDYYDNGVPRLVEYYPDLDFYKIKANWHPKQNYEMRL